MIDWLTLSSSCSIPNMSIYQKSFRSSYYLARWPENVPFSKFLHFTRIRIRHIEYGIESVWAPHSFWFSSKKFFYLIFSLYFSTFKFISNFLNNIWRYSIFRQFYQFKTPELWYPWNSAYWDSISCFTIVSGFNNVIRKFSGGGRIQMYSSSLKVYYRQALV